MDKIMTKCIQETGIDISYGKDFILRIRSLVILIIRSEVKGCHQVPVKGRLHNQALP